MFNGEEMKGLQNQGCRTIENSTVVEKENQIKPYFSRREIADGTVKKTV